MIKPKFKVITNTSPIEDNTPNIYKYNNVIHKKLKNINGIKARKQLYNWNLLDFPVFTYKKITPNLQIELNNIYLIFEHINNLQVNIDNNQRKLYNAGLAINIFINNSFNATESFNYQQQFIIIRNGKLEIHSNIELDTALVQNEIQFLHYDESELLQLIKPNINTFTITRQQQILFDQLSDKYIEYVQYDDILNTDYDSAFEVYERLLISIQNELINVPIINLTTNDKIEIFDEDIHDLVSLNQNSSIEIFYVNKEFQNELMNFLTIQNKREN